MNIQAVKESPVIIVVWKKKEKYDAGNNTEHYGVIWALF